MGAFSASLTFRTPRAPLSGPDGKWEGKRAASPPNAGSRQLRRTAADSPRRWNNSPPPPRLQQAVLKASRRIQQGSDKMALASALKTVSAGVEMVFGSAAAISAAFGHADRWGLTGLAECFCNPPFGAVA